MDGDHIPFARSATVLGLTLTRTGINSHIKNRLAAAKTQRKKLKKFKRLKPKTNIQLYKTLLRPILEYPAVPICTSSKSNKKMLQQYQNVTIRNSIKGSAEDRDKTIEELHEQFNIEAINVRLHKRANSTWERVARVNPALIENSKLESLNRERKDHLYWPRIEPYTSSEQPEPILRF